MSKLYDFLEKAAGDDGSSAQINSILGGNKFEDATDEQLSEICEVAKKLGFDIAPDDIREGIVRELSEDELGDVAGGSPMGMRPDVRRVYKRSAGAADDWRRCSTGVKFVSVGERTISIVS